MEPSLLLEAVLFYKAEPVQKTSLMESLKMREADLNKAIASLKETLGGRGIQILETSKEIGLVTAPEASATLEALAKEELEGPLTHAAEETLAIVLYLATVSKAEIDYIRGVNSHYILKSLEVRGLIDKKPNPHNKNSFFYEPSAELLANLGIVKTSDLPEYAAYKQTLSTLKTEYHGEAVTTDTTE